MNGCVTVNVKESEARAEIIRNIITNMSQVFPFNMCQAPPRNVSNAAITLLSSHIPMPGI